MITLSCYHDEMITLSCYHDEMITLSCYHDNMLSYFFSWKLHTLKMVQLKKCITRPQKTFQTILNCKCFSWEWGMSSIALCFSPPHPWLWSPKKNNMQIRAAALHRIIVISPSKVPSCPQPIFLFLLYSYSNLVSVLQYLLFDAYIFIYNSV
jgi:hypothetical protein